MAAELIHPDGERILPAADLCDELLELLEPVAQELGGADLLELGEPEALRQLEIGRSQGLDSLCVDLVEGTVSSP